MKTYRVWVCVEMHDPSAKDSADEYQEMDLPVGGVGEFRTLDAAESLALRLHQVGVTVAALMPSKKFFHPPVQVGQCHICGHWGDSCTGKDK